MNDILYETSTWARNEKPEVFFLHLDGFFSSDRQRVWSGWQPISVNKEACEPSIQALILPPCLCSRFISVIMSNKVQPKKSVFFIVQNFNNFSCFWCLLSPTTAERESIWRNISLLLLSLGEWTYVYLAFTRCFCRISKRLFKHK